MNAFAMQLGYLNNIEVVLDSEEILLPAAENLIAKVGYETEQALSDAIIDYVGQLADDGKSWNNLPQSFTDFAQNLFSDSKIKYLDKIQDLGIGSLKNISSQLLDYQINIERNIQEITASFIDLCLKNGLDSSDFLLGSRSSILAVMQKRNAGIEIFNEFSKTVLKVHQGGWYPKTSKNKELIDFIKGDLLELFCQYESIIENEAPKYILLKAIQKNLFKLSLLRQFKLEIESIKSETGSVHISEFNKAILNVVANEPVPYIYERIGERFNHIMIDEFQDTSPIQFQNFLPLFANSLGNHQFCMVVGDPKQAIYRFRGGDMTQIIHLFNRDTNRLKKDIPEESFLRENLDQINPHLKAENLKVNYRSLSEIIDFNNELFGLIKNHGPFNQRFPLLEKTFDATYFQEKPASVQSGAHIQIIFKNEINLNPGESTTEVEDNPVEKGNSNENEESLDKSKFEDPKILEIIQNCTQNGYQSNDIAILCRTKIVAKAIANYLKNNGLSVISSDSVLLSFSNSLNFLMDLMEVMANNNQLVRYQSICHFHQCILKAAIPPNEGIINQIVENEDISLLFNYFKSYDFEIDLEKVKKLSLYELAEYFIHSFQLLDNQNEQEYIFTFLDEVINFRLKKSDNILDFVEYWKLNKSKLSIVSKGAKAITITTIHKSKGLQYPVVILPEANWLLNLKANSSIWVHLEELEYEEFIENNTQNELKIASLNSQKELSRTAINDQFQDELELHFLEAINLLYVALTRAKEQLYIISKHKFKEEKSKSELESINLQTVGDLLYYFLVSKGVFNFSKQDYILNLGIPKLQSASKLEKQMTAVSIRNTFNKKAKPRLADYQKDNQQETLNKERGNKVHQILSEILSKNDIEMAINKAVIAGILNNDEKEAIKKKIEDLLSLTEISPYFESGLLVKNEMEIMLPDGNTQRPDRVNFSKNETIIIDYKTGHPRPEYMSQLRLYGNLLKEMGYPTPKMLLLYLDESKVVEVA